MKKLNVLVWLFLLPLGMMAEEAGDTTLVLNDKKIVVADSSGITNVKVFSANGKEKRMTFEGHYTDEREEERFYFSSPFYNTRYAPTTPKIFAGLNMLPSSVFAFKNANGMHVNTWKSYEAGINFIDMGFWLNKKNTWSLSLIEHVLLNTTRFSSNYVLSEDADGNSVIVDKGQDISKSHLFTVGVRTQLMLKWYKYYTDKAGEKSRLSVGAGFSVDDAGLERHSSYRLDGHTYPAGAGFEMHSARLGFDCQVSYEGLIFYLHQSLTPMFRSGKGPKCYPLSIGFGVSF